MEDDIRKEFRELWKDLNAVKDLINKNLTDTNSSRFASDKTISERTSSLEKTLELVSERQQNVRERVGDLEKHYDGLNKVYVTKQEYAVVKYIVNTIVGLFVVGCVTSLIRLILPHADFTQ